jgi:hypothetical protein
METDGRQWVRDPRFSGEALMLFAGENPGFPASKEVFRLRRKRDKQWIYERERGWERERRERERRLRKPKKR